MTKDIRVGVKVQNNLILAKMEEVGIKNVAELSRATGIQPCEVRDLINIGKTSCTKKGAWRKPVLKLADFFKCLPRDLFTEFQRENILEKNSSHMEMDFVEIQTMLAVQNAPLLEPSAQAESHELSAVLETTLNKMDPKIRMVLRARFGFDGEEMTLKEVGKILGVTGDRARQIEAEGLHLLRHPSRLDLLRDASGMTYCPKWEKKKRA